MNRDELILKEIEIVQSEIARFDGNSLTVKEWCLAIWAALIAYGVERNNAIAVGAAVITTVSFAIVELMYRKYQCRFIARSQRIEDMLSSGNFDKYEYEVHRSAVGLIGETCSELKWVIRLPHFTIFYSLLIIFAIACVFYVDYPTCK